MKFSDEELDELLGSSRPAALDPPMDSARRARHLRQIMGAEFAGEAVVRSADLHASSDFMDRTGESGGRRRLSVVAVVLATVAASVAVPFIVGGDRGSEVTQLVPAPVATPTPFDPGAKIGFGYVPRGYRWTGWSSSAELARAFRSDFVFEGEFDGPKAGGIRRGVNAKIWRSDLGLSEVSKNNGPMRKLEVPLGRALVVKDQGSDYPIKIAYWEPEPGIVVLFTAAHVPRGISELVRLLQGLTYRT